MGLSILSSWFLPAMMMYLLVLMSICKGTQGQVNLLFPPSIDFTGMTRIFHDDFDEWKYYDFTKTQQSPDVKWQTWLERPGETYSDCWARFSESDEDQQIYGDPYIGLTPHSSADSILHIQGTKIDEAIFCTDGPETYNFTFTSGMISTYNRTFFEGTYLEISAKFDEKRGQDTRFRLLSSRHRAENIQISGYYGGDIYQYAVYVNSTSQSYNDAELPQVASAFNRYGILWADGKMGFYLNGTLQRTIPFPVPKNVSYVLAITQAIYTYWAAKPDPEDTWPWDLQLDFVSAYAIQTCDENTTAGVLGCRGGLWQVYNDSLTIDDNVVIAGTINVQNNVTFGVKTTFLYPGSSVNFGDTAILQGPLLINLTAGFSETNITLLNGTNFQGEFTKIRVVQQGNACSNIKAIPQMQGTTFGLILDYSACVKSGNSRRKTIIIASTVGGVGLLAILSIAVIIIIVVYKRANPPKIIAVPTTSNNLL